MWQGVIKEYREYLPVKRDDCIVTLLEGNTPLIPSIAVPKMLGIDVKVYFKHEGINPTASFKDRGMTVAVSKAKEDGAKAIICASTGNTSASASAYGARAGMKTCVILPKGKIATGKLSQALAHGAVVIEIDGNFDDALELVKEVSRRYPITLVNSINPYRIEGQKTSSFEICDVLGRAPDYHFIPVGNAGNISAYWKGYNEYKANGRIQKLPRMMGFQAEGAAPIVRGRVIKNPETIATAIRIGNPANWEMAVKARDESSGIIDMVSDEDIISAYKFLGTVEGISCEPASAASLAGLFKYVKTGRLKSSDVIVCTLTGHGLKDPDTAVKTAQPTHKIKPEISSIIKLLNL